MISESTNLYLTEQMVVLY